MGGADPVVEKQGGKGEVVGRCCVVKGLVPPPGARGAHGYENRCLALLKEKPAGPGPAHHKGEQGLDPKGWLLG